MTKAKEKRPFLGAFRSGLAYDKPAFAVRRGQEINPPLNRLRLASQFSLSGHGRYIRRHAVGKGAERLAHQTLHAQEVKFPCGVCAEFGGPLGAGNNG